MISSVPGRRRFCSGRLLASATSRAVMPLARAMLGERLAAPHHVLAEVHPLLGRQLRDARRPRSAPGRPGTRSAKVRSAGVASRRSSGFRARIVLDGLARALGDHAQVEGALDRDALEVGALVRGDGEAVALRGLGQHDRRVDERHVVLRLAPQPPRLAQLPEVVGLVPLHGAQHLALARVVAGEGEVPVAEQLVEVLQVARGGARGLLGVAALVHPPVAARP